MRYLVVILLLVFGQMSEAVVRWAGPTDLGNSPCTTQASPCGLAEAIGVAQAGDEVVLRNGTYANTQIVTIRNGTASARIVIRAENRHQAILVTPNPPAHRTPAIRLLHSYTTIRDLVIEGNQTIHFGFTTQGTTAIRTGLVVEHNIFRNLGGVGAHIWYVNGMIVRHNVFDGMGYFSSDDCCGEGFYVSSGSSNVPVDNLEIYGNTIRDATNNAVDLKGVVSGIIQVRNVSIHHNIVENFLLPVDHNPARASEVNDGLWVQWAADTQVNDNIIRNSKIGSSLFRMYGNGNNKALRNVVYNSSNGSVVRSIGSLGLATSEVAFNTYCSLSTYNNHSAGITGINVHDNNANRPQSECDAEVTRILNEMANLPGGGGTAPTPQLQPPVLSFN